MTQQEFISLILPLRDRLFRLAWHILDNREEAEDVVQDVMMAIWNKEEKNGEVENWEAYGYTMTRNLALNRLVRKGNRHLPLDADKAVEEEVQNTLERKERLAWMHHFMELLTYPQRDIIRLRDIEGLSYNEIAVVLGLSEEQVKVYLFRARNKIRECCLKVENYGLQQN